MCLCVSCVCVVCWQCVCDRHLQQVQFFLEAIYNDEGFADRVAHQCNKWCAITQWIMYNTAAILIFAVNSQVYRVD